MRVTSLQQHFTGAEDVARAHGDDHVAGLRQLFQLVGHLLQRGTVDGVGDLCRQIP